jgi:hypothetical protein
LGDEEGGFLHSQTYNSGFGPFDITAGDFDLDRDLDLAIVNFMGDDITVYHGNGTGEFFDRQDYAVGDQPYCITTGDFDLDGDIDLAVTNIGDDNVSVLYNNGNGWFGEQRREDFEVGDGPLGIVAGDFNGDDTQDLAVTNIAGDSISILISDGNGGFLPQRTYSVGDGPSMIVTGDFNADNAIDLALTNTYELNFSVLLNDGKGRFSNRKDYYVGEHPFSIATGDFNNDGDLDLAVSHETGWDEFINIYLGDNTGGFWVHQVIDIGSAVWDINTGDFDHDGILDLAIALPNNVNCVCILMGDGTGGFGNRHDIPIEENPIQIVTGHFDSNNLNLPPTTPMINGSISGKTGEVYTYTLVTDDPEGDDVSYLIDWGDHVSPTWSDFQPSGNYYSVSHKWRRTGTYMIQVKAKDIYGARSGRTTLEVSFPRTSRSAGSYWYRFSDMYLILQKILISIL